MFVKKEMERIKINTGYYQSGYRKGLNRNAIVYLIGGKLYAKDLKGWKTSFNPLQGDLKGYVRVNAYGKEPYTIYTEVSGFGEYQKHKQYEKQNTLKGVCPSG